MNRFYITFPNRYAKKEHPILPREVAHPNAIVEIFAPDWPTAYALARGVAGEEGEGFSHLFVAGYEASPNSTYFPLGVTARVEYTELVPVDR